MQFSLGASETVTVIAPILQMRKQVTASFHDLPGPYV